MRRLTLLALLSAGGLWLAAITSAGATLFCPVLKSPDGFVALRSGPGPRFPIVVRMKADDEVQVLEGRKGPWTQVRHW